MDLPNTDDDDDDGDELERLRTENAKLKAANKALERRLGSAKASVSVRVTMHVQVK